LRGDTPPGEGAGQLGSAASPRGEQPQADLPRHDLGVGGPLLGMPRILPPAPMRLRAPSPPGHPPPPLPRPPPPPPLHPAAPPPVRRPRAPAAAGHADGCRASEVDRDTGPSAAVQPRPDAELLLDLLLDLVGQVRVVPQEVPRVLLALPELIAVVGVPGAGLPDEAVLDTHVDQRT